MGPKASIIITAHNYGEYLPEALDSALGQTYDSFEVIVVDDGSTDETPDIIREYEFEYPNTLRTIRLEGEGVSAASNAGIEAADGEYIVRLDADDYFDENLLTVEVNYLENHEDVALVYPDYHEVSEDGELLNYVRLPDVEDEVKLLSRLPIGTGTLMRKDAWEAIGGYDEAYYYQEDYDFWIRFVNEFDVHNVSLPLLYYRQHDSSKSDNVSARLEARRGVKEKFVQNNIAEQLETLEILCIIPAREEKRFDYRADTSDPLALRDAGGRPLLDYTIHEALAADKVDRVIVDTESQRIADRAETLGADVPFLRADALTNKSVMLSEVLRELLKQLKAMERYVPDIMVLPQYISPLRTADHINEAVDTFLMFNVDSVISVTKNKKFLWQPGKFGLDPLFEQRKIREERETIYQENGAVTVTTPELIRDKDDLVGNRVGHIAMEEFNSLHIDSKYDFWTCDRVLSDADIMPNYVSDQLT